MQLVHIIIMLLLLLLRLMMMMIMMMVMTMMMMIADQLAQLIEHRTTGEIAGSNPGRSGALNN